MGAHSASSSSSSLPKRSNSHDQVPVTLWTLPTPQGGQRLPHAGVSAAGPLAHQMQLSADGHEIHGNSPTRAHALLGSPNESIKHSPGNGGSGLGRHAGLRFVRANSPHSPQSSQGASHLRVAPMGVGPRPSPARAVTPPAGAFRW